MSAAIVATVMLDDAQRRLVSDVFLTPAPEFVHYASVGDLLIALQKFPPAVLIMPLGKSSEAALAVQEKFRRAFDPLCVIYLATEPSMESVVRAMRLGAVEVLSSDWKAHDLAEGIARASVLYLVRVKMLNAARLARRQLSELSGRQFDVMRMVVVGMKNKAIGVELGVSEKTVEKHRSAIHRRTTTANLPDLVRLNSDAEQSLDAAFHIGLEPLNLPDAIFSPALPPLPSTDFEAGVVSIS